MYVQKQNGEKQRGNLWKPMGAHLKGTRRRLLCFTATKSLQTQTQTQTKTHIQRFWKDPICFGVCISLQKETYK